MTVFCINLPGKTSRPALLRPQFSIASACGISGSSCFSTTFRKIFGMPRREFRGRVPGTLMLLEPVKKLK